MFESESCCVVYVSLKLTIFLPLHPKCWDYGHLPPGPIVWLYKVTLCNLGWPLIHYLAKVNLYLTAILLPQSYTMTSKVFCFCFFKTQAGLKLRNPSAMSSEMLGIKVYPNQPGNPPSILSHYLTKQDPI